jgi:hypothetical protein
MSNVEPLLPSLARGRTKRIPSGIEVLTPEKAIRLRLPHDCNAKQFLEAVFRHPRMPFAVRMEAAIACMPYTVPKLLAVVQAPAGTDPRELRISIQGGLPPLPGSQTIMPPNVSVRPARAPEPEPQRVETQIGTCVVGETS